MSSDKTFKNHLNLSQKQSSDKLLLGADHIRFVKVSDIEVQTNSFRLIKRRQYLTLCIPNSMLETSKSTSASGLGEVDITYLNAQSDKYVWPTDNEILCFPVKLVQKGKEYMNVNEDPVVLTQTDVKNILNIVQKIEKPN